MAFKFANNLLSMLLVSDCVSNASAATQNNHVPWLDLVANFSLVTCEHRLINEMLFCGWKILIKESLFCYSNGNIANVVMPLFQKKPKVNTRLSVYIMQADNGIF